MNVKFVNYYSFNFHDMCIVGMLRYIILNVYLYIIYNRLYNILKEFESVVKDSHPFLINSFLTNDYIIYIIYYI